MKKIKFAFAIAAGLIVGLSSFTQPKSDTTFYANVGGAPVPVLASQEGISWKCISGSQYCVYLDQALTHPRESSPNRQFVIIP